MAKNRTRNPRNAVLGVQFKDHTNCPNKYHTNTATLHTKHDNWLLGASNNTRN